MATLEQMSRTLAEDVWAAVAHFHNIMPDDVSEERGIEFLSEEMQISTEEAWMRLQMETDIPAWCELEEHHRDHFEQFFLQAILPVLVGMSKHIVDFHNPSGCQEQHGNPGRN